MIKFLGKTDNRSGSIIFAATILAVASVLSRLLGLLRDRLLAGNFGAGDTLDVYYAAFRLPDLIYNLLVMGALSAGFIPVFVSLWNKNEEGNKETWRFVSSVLNILLIGLLVLGTLFFILAPFLMKLITPGFDSAKLALTVLMTRLMFLSPILLGVSAIFGGVLQSLKRFLAFSLAPIFYNLGIILGILFLVPRFGVLGLAFGVLLGGFLHLLIQSAPIWFSDFKYQPIIDWGNEGVRRLAKMIIPRALTLAISQLNFLAITVLASTLTVGSLAIFNLSYNIWTFPLGVFAGSLAMAVFPTLSENVAKKDWPGFAANFSENFRQISFLIMPISAFFIVLAGPIVRVILGTGKFGAMDMILAVKSLIFLSLGLLAESLILLLARGFFAFDDTQTPFWLGLFSSIIRISGAWFFSLSFGVAGLALGYALGGILYMILLWAWLHKKVGNLNEGEILLSLFKMVVASLLAASVVWISWQTLALKFPSAATQVILLQGFIAGLAGILVYFLAGLVLQLRETTWLWQKIKGQLFFDNNLK